MRRATRGPASRAGTVAAGLALTGLVVALGVAQAPPGAATGGWTRLPHDEALFGGTGNVAMQGVASTTSGFIAVGSDSATTDAAVWYSADGTGWTRATPFASTAAELGGPDLQYMYDVAQCLGNANGPGNVVAVGSSGPGSQQDAAVWTGAGNTWKRVKDQAPALGGTGDQVMWGVAGAGPGVVAVGGDKSGGDWTPRCGRPPTERSGRGSRTTRPSSGDTSTKR